MEQTKYSDRITICAYNLLFFNDIAHSQAMELVSYIKKLPVYKQQVKKTVNGIQKEVQRYSLLIKQISLTKGGTFYADVCDNMADEVRKDLVKLEYSIKNALDRKKIENSTLLAKIETARCLAWGSCINLDMRVRDIRKELPVSLSEMRLTSLSHQIELLASIFYKGTTRTVDFNKDENCLLAFRIIQKKLLNGQKIAQSINQAENEACITPMQDQQQMISPAIM